MPNYEKEREPMDEAPWDWSMDASLLDHHITVLETDLHNCTESC